MAGSSFQKRLEPASFFSFSTSILPMNTFKSLLSIAFLFCLPLLLTFQLDANQEPAPTKSAWRNLFNGKDLAGWDSYIGPLFSASGALQKDLPPLGLNNDPQKVFSVAMEDGQNALHVSGEQFGGVSTQEEFENYHLQLQFKWGKLKWVPKKNSKMDSGVLYHANGAHGADGGFWMQSQEYQVQEGDCGDYWGVAGGAFEVTVKKQGEKDWIYDPSGALLSFSEKSPEGRHCIRSADYEKPLGQWNTIDIYCLAGTSVHLINGKVNMVLRNSQHIVGDKMEPLTKGKIQIQSEGAEVFYRNIKIRSIDKIPVALFK
jgi:hypothetical protein